MTLDAVMVNEVMYVPGTWGCHFFTLSKAERVSCAKTERILGRAQVGGWARGKSQMLGRGTPNQKKTGRIADRPVKPCVFAQRAKSMANK